MRIGIDARQLAGPVHGTARALASILREWARRGTRGHEVFLYSPRPLRLPFEHPFHLRSRSLAIRLTGGTFWLQAELPGLAAPDKLDVFWATTDIAPLPLARLLPCLVTVHDLGAYRIPDKLPTYIRLIYALFFRRSLKAASRIACTTEAVRQELGGLGLDGGKVEVVPHGVDPGRFSGGGDAATVLRRLAIEGPYFLFVGHLRPNKNLERTLEAFRGFLARLGDAPKPLLVLAGGRTRTDAPILSLMQSPDLRAHVRYAGFLEDGELAAVYRSALAFVSPSLYEGFGLPYLEAMAAGLPVIAPAIPTVSEVCGEAALYVDPRDTASIEDAFRSLYHDEARHEGLRRLGLERAARFSWSSAAESILELLERTGAGRPLSQKQVSYVQASAR